VYRAFPSIGNVDGSSSGTSEAGQNEMIDRFGIEDVMNRRPRATVSGTDTCHLRDANLLFVDPGAADGSWLRSFDEHVVVSWQLNAPFRCDEAKSWPARVEIARIGGSFPASQNPISARDGRGRFVTNPPSPGCSCVSAMFDATAQPLGEIERTGSETVHAKPIASAAPVANGLNTRCCSAPPLFGGAEWGGFFLLGHGVGNDRGLPTSQHA